MTQKSKTIVVVLFSVGVFVAVWIEAHTPSNAVARWITLAIVVVANVLVWVIWLMDRKGKGGSGSFWSRFRRPKT